MVIGSKIPVLFPVPHEPSEDAGEIHAGLMAEAEQGGVQFTGFGVVLAEPEVVGVVLLHDEGLDSTVGKCDLFHL